MSILTCLNHRCGRSDQKNVTYVSLEAVKATMF